MKLHSCEVRQAYLEGLGKTDPGLETAPVRMSARIDS